MPKVTITRTWPDEEKLHITVSTEPDDHPDGVLSETARVALESFAAAHGVVLASEVADETDES